MAADVNDVALMQETVVSAAALTSSPRTSPCSSPPLFGVSTVEECSYRRLMSWKKSIVARWVFPNGNLPRSDQHLGQASERDRMTSSHRCRSAGSRGHPDCRIDTQNTSTCSFQPAASQHPGERRERSKAWSYRFARFHQHESIRSHWWWFCSRHASPCLAGPYIPFQSHRCPRAEMAKHS